MGGSIRWGRWDKFVGEPVGAALVAYLNPNFTEWWATPPTADGQSRLSASAVPNERAMLDAWEAGARRVAAHRCSRRWE